MSNLSHVMVLDTVRTIGPHQVPEVILFNNYQISAEDALRKVQADEYDKNVLCIPKEQWISLFKDGREEDTEDPGDHWLKIREANTVDGAGRPVYYLECPKCHFEWNSPYYAKTFKHCPGCGKPLAPPEENP